ncbi:hypothetical protein [Lentilitoribacter sp. Alg239-R112]|uniref:hypothetical protein n=1 Tax=Lentilitoribacter sp. Alg239-R112 TaxID=2305987 RepID=UPI0013A7094C|nr:hypothetical protein [Lentilitoribacter sp. Alg239-R112]
MKSLFAALALLLSLNSVLAQDAQGNDTPGDWVVTHYKPFGLWDSVCDQAKRDGSIMKRCYLRYVEVFSPAPKFAAQFLFITPEKEGLKVELGIEKGTLFKGKGLKIINDEKELWSFDPNMCLNFGECVFEGDEAEIFITAMAEPYEQSSKLISDFTDRHGAGRLLDWDLSQFSDAVSDFKIQSKQRKLIK